MRRLIAEASEWLSLSKEAGKHTEIGQALKNGGRWIRAFNKNCVLMPNGDIVGIPKGVDTSKYKPGDPKGKSAVFRGPDKVKVRGETALKRMSKRKLGGYVKRMKRGKERAEKLRKSMHRDIKKIDRSLAVAKKILSEK